MKIAAMTKALIRHEMLPVVLCASPWTVLNQDTYVEATVDIEHRHLMLQRLQWQDGSASSVITPLTASRMLTPLLPKSSLQLSQRPKVESTCRELHL